jgi:hypothetical protein
LGSEHHTPTIINQALSVLAGLFSFSLQDNSMKAYIQILADGFIFHYRLIPLLDSLNGLVAFSGLCSDMRGSAPDVRQVDFLFGDRAKIFTNRLRSWRKKGLPQRGKEHYRDIVEMTPAIRRKAIAWLFEVENRKD